MTKFRSLFLYPLAGMLIALATAPVSQALDANANGTSASKGNSMDEVARMIRQTSRWQILEATPKKSGSGMRYRFKLISNSGKVKIISIDPLRPNLRRLEQ